MVGPAGVSELIGTSGNVYFELIGNACDHNLAATASKRNIDKQHAVLRRAGWSLRHGYMKGTILTYGSETHSVIAPSEPLMHMSIFPQAEGRWRRRIEYGDLAVGYFQEP